MKDAPLPDLRVINDVDVPEKTAFSEESLGRFLHESVNFLDADWSERMREIGNVALVEGATKSGAELFFRPNLSGRPNESEKPDVTFPEGASKSQVGSRKYDVGAIPPWAHSILEFSQSANGANQGSVLPKSLICFWENFEPVAGEEAGQADQQRSRLIIKGKTKEGTSRTLQLHYKGEHLRTVHVTEEVDHEVSEMMIGMARKVVLGINRTEQTTAHFDEPFATDSRYLRLRSKDGFTVVNRSPEPFIEDTEPKSRKQDQESSRAADEDVNGDEQTFRSDKTENPQEVRSNHLIYTVGYQIPVAIKQNGNGRSDGNGSGESSARLHLGANCLLEEVFYAEDSSRSKGWRLDRDLLRVGRLLVDDSDRTVEFPGVEAYGGCEMELHLRTAYFNPIFVKPNEKPGESEKEAQLLPNLGHSSIAEHLQMMGVAQSIFDLEKHREAEALRIQREALMNPGPFIGSI